MAWKLERQGYTIWCGRTDELTNWDTPDNLYIAFLKNFQKQGYALSSDD